MQIVCRATTEAGNALGAQETVTTDPEKLGPRVEEVDGRQMLRLLHDCSGAFEPGVLTALVGVSGAGQAVFLFVLLACPAPSPLVSHFLFLSRLRTVAELLSFRWGMPLVLLIVQRFCQPWDLCGT